jgi:hypothetical protein
VMLSQRAAAAMRTCPQTWDAAGRCPQKMWHAWIASLCFNFCGIEKGRVGTLGAKKASTWFLCCKREKSSAPAFNANRTNYLAHYIGRRFTSTMKSTGGSLAPACMSSTVSLRGGHALKAHPVALGSVLRPRSSSPVSTDCSSSNNGCSTSGSSDGIAHTPRIGPRALQRFVALVHQISSSPRTAALEGCPELKSLRCVP